MPRACRRAMWLLIRHPTGQADGQAWHGDRESGLIRPSPVGLDKPLGLRVPFYGTAALCHATCRGQGDAEVAWRGPGQQAGSGKAAAGCAQSKDEGQADGNRFEKGPGLKPEKILESI